MPKTCVHFLFTATAGYCSCKEGRVRARGQRRGRWWRCKRWKRCRRWRWRCGGQLSRSSCTGCHSLAADSTKEAFSFFALQADIEAVHRSTNGSNISHRGSRSALFPHLQPPLSLPLFSCLPIPTECHPFPPLWDRASAVLSSKPSSLRQIRAAFKGIVSFLPLPAYPSPLPLVFIPRLLTFPSNHSTAPDESFPSCHWESHLGSRKKWQHMGSTGVIEVFQIPNFRLVLRFDTSSDFWHVSALFQLTQVKRSQELWTSLCQSWYCSLLP